MRARLVPSSRALLKPHVDPDVRILRRRRNPYIDVPLHTNIGMFTSVKTDRSLPFPPPPSLDEFLSRPACLLRSFLLLLCRGSFVFVHIWEREPLWFSSASAGGLEGVASLLRWSDERQSDESADRPHLHNRRIHRRNERSRDRQPSADRRVPHRRKPTPRKTPQTRAPPAEDAPHASLQRQVAFFSLSQSKLLLAAPFARGSL